MKDSEKVKVIVKPEADLAVAHFYLCGGGYLSYRGFQVSFRLDSDSMQYNMENMGGTLISIFIYFKPHFRLSVSQY